MKEIMKEIKYAIILHHNFVWFIVSLLAWVFVVNEIIIFGAELKYMPIIVAVHFFHEWKHDMTEEKFFILLGMHKHDK